MKHIEIYVMGLILTCAGWAFAGIDTNETNLGVTEGKSITNGFVFVDGEYLEPPYVVTRQGAGIYINNHLVEQLSPWPIPTKPKPVIPTEDPKVPASINEQTSQFDSDLLQYHMAKWSYYHDRLNLRGEDFSEAMAKAYSQLPCIKEAKCGSSPEYIEVTWVNGNTQQMRVIPPTRKPIEWTRATLMKQLEKDRTMYEKCLERGDYYFLGEAVSRTTGTLEGAKGLLPNMLEILKTSKDAKEVQERFQQAGYINWGKHAAEACFNNRASWEPLEKRLGVLK